MAKSLVLRCQFGDGQRQILKGLTTDSTVFDLKDSVAKLTNIPVDFLKILNGFPPKELDIRETNVALHNLPIRSGDTLVVAQNKPTSNNTPAENKPVGNHNNFNATAPRICRKVVPADNSCLFASVSFTILGDVGYADDIRNLAAQCIKGDQDTYTEAFLGKTNTDYVNWLLKKDSWGGAIELNVISKNYNVEINVADIQSGRIDRFGEDLGFENRIYLLYDGIHYDPLGLGNDDVIVQTVFPCSDNEIEHEVLQLARECKKKFEFTDLSNFSLRCLICNTPLKGQSEAQSHAKSTGHMNFGECKK